MLDLSELKGPAQSRTEERVDVKPVELNEAFTNEALQAAWNDFAESRKVYQAEYHMLMQSYTLTGTTITLHLLSAIQETMLNGLRQELTLHLRERLRNSSIQVLGEVTVQQDQKVIYTNREKLEYLMQKNPVLKEMKERLGLDADF